MNCCAECFGDRGLSTNIIPPLSTGKGRCCYCESDDVLVIDPKQLAAYFELLVSAYRQDDSGELLIHWFRKDWALFRHSRMLEDSRANSLLCAILDDKHITCNTFMPAKIPTAHHLSEWEALRDELMHHNRYFPDNPIDLDRLEDLLGLLVLNGEEVPTLWYRARIQVGDTIFKINEMGSPSNKSASHGRANPAGIPYLYLGSDPQAAISEIRPHMGELVCVADFKTRPNLRLVDLRSPRKMVSPFLLEDAEQIGEMLSDLPFLERLGDELTRPVIPQSAAIDYTPSQYLCEFIKKSGFDGVVYRSSVSDGINLALFNPALATVGSVKQYDVRRVSVEVALRGA